MKTYSIKLKFTCPYIGARNGGNKTLQTGLTLKEAQVELLNLYNEKYEGERPYAPNWGLAVAHSRKNIFGATPTYSDGTRSFGYDSRCYLIEIEDEDV